MGSWRRLSLPKGRHKGGRVKACAWAKPLTCLPPMLICTFIFIIFMPPIKDGLGDSFGGPAKERH